MAACGSLERIFEKPLPENPTLLESLSPWKHIKSMTTHPKIDDSSLTELFGELHFKDSSNSSHEQPPPPLSSSGYICPKRQYRHSDSFSSMNSESLSLCTEGLGFESFDDDPLKNDPWQMQDQGKKICSPSRNTNTEKSCRSSASSGGFPPPISCIGRSGKPWFWFKSYRHDGRFILKGIRIPTQEFLHACREDGRLKLQFIQSDDEIIEEDEEEEDDDMCSNGDENGEIDRDCVNQGSS